MTDNAATDRAAWTEHCAEQLMLQGLAGGGPGVVAAPPAPEPPEPEAEPARPQWSEPEAAPCMTVEEYAVLYPQRAALIRRLGRVPEDVSFGPPPPELVRALVASRSPALLKLDREASGRRSV